MDARAKINFHLLALGERTRHICHRAKHPFDAKARLFSLHLTLVKGLEIVSLSETTIDVKTNQIFRSVPIPLHQIGNRIVATIAFP